MVRKITIEEFVKRSNEIYENKYDYSKVNYSGYKIHITIDCKKHGEFMRTPSEHLSGKGCQKCKENDQRRHLQEEFIKKANEIHENTYNYDKVKYKDCDTNVIINCKEHGDFLQTPYSHVNRKRKCHKCSGNFTITTEEFIQKAKKVHKEKYDYRKVNYINSDTHVIIICNKCDNEFRQTPYHHLCGQNCPGCVGGVAYTQEQFIEIAKKVHKDIYDYSEVSYKNGRTEVKIYCKKHENYFEQMPEKHLMGHGCNVCVNKTAAKLFVYLLQKFSSVDSEAKFNWCRNPTTNCYLPFDFYIKEINCIIELDGRQHFEQVKNWDSPEIIIKKDVFKIQQANKKSISIIRLLQGDVYKRNDKWLDDNLLPLLVKNENFVNHYVCGDKNKNIYDKHKGLYLDQIKVKLQDIDFFMKFIEEGHKLRTEKRNELKNEINKMIEEMNKHKK